MISISSEHSDRISAAAPVVVFVIFFQFSFLIIVYHFLSDNLFTSSSVLIIQCGQWVIAYVLEFDQIQ